MSGTIGLSEFAVLARDLRVFIAFDRSGDGRCIQSARACPLHLAADALRAPPRGSLDSAELLPALAHLGLVASADVAARVLAAWDEDNSQTIDLAEFSGGTYPQHNNSGTTTTAAQQQRPRRV